MADQTQEPQFFIAGDTLSFTKSVTDYGAGAGWSMVYAVTDLAGNEVVAVTSTADGDNHKIYQDSFLSGAEAGTYVLTGSLVKGTQRKTIYMAQLTLQGNLPAGLSSQPTKSTAQQMIELILSTLRDIYASRFAETEVQRNRFTLADETDALNSLKYWREVDANDKQWERARNGQASGMNKVPVFNIGC